MMRESHLLFDWLRGIEYIHQVISHMLVISVYLSIYISDLKPIDVPSLESIKLASLLFLFDARGGGTLG